MKLKYYLRGIGVGILVTTVILMIAFAVHKEQPLSDDEIMERAAQLGMVMPDKLPVSDKLSDTVQANEPEEQTDEQTGQIEKDTSETESAASENDGSEPSKGQAEQSQEGEKTQKEVIEQVEISIVGGEYSDVVCKKLKKAGIIEDADDFNKYLAKSGYDNLIQPGNYVIPVDATYDEIIKIITEKKDKKR